MMAVKNAIFARRIIATNEFMNAIQDRLDE
jgi:hypothetical protein